MNTMNTMNVINSLNYCECEVFAKYDHVCQYIEIHDEECVECEYCIRNTEKQMLGLCMCKYKVIRIMKCHKCELVKERIKYLNAKTDKLAGRLGSHIKEHLVVNKDILNELDSVALELRKLNRFLTIKKLCFA